MTHREDRISRLERQVLNWSDITQISYYRLREDEQLLIMLLKGEPKEEIKGYIENYICEDDGWE